MISFCFRHITQGFSRVKRFIQGLKEKTLNVCQDQSTTTTLKIHLKTITFTQIIVSGGTFILKEAQQPIESSRYTS